jgi:RNA polymerase sigma-70 factor (ECF subfamily)
MLNGELVQKINRTERLAHPLAITDQVDLADRVLLQQVAAAEESALTGLYEKYGQRLYAYACRLTGDPAQAEDVLQEALIAVWRTAGRFRGEGRVIAWLLGIVHHQAVKSLRRRPVLFTPEMEETLRSRAPLPEEIVQDGSQSEQLRQAIQSLSSEHREVLELIFFQKLSYEETARVTGCPLGTVKSRVNQAHAQLKGILTRMGAGMEVEQ